MEIETLEAMNESIYLSESLMIEVTMWIIILSAVAGFAVYLAASVWLCFEEMRRPARRQVKQAPELRPAENDAAPIPVTLDDNLGDKLAGVLNKKITLPTSNFRILFRLFK